MVLYRRSRSYSSFGRYGPAQSSALQSDYNRLIHRSFTSSHDLLSRGNRSTQPYYDYNTDLPYESVTLSRAPSYTYEAINPFYPITHAIDAYPLRKYDLYAPGLWSYPLWKYLYDPTPIRHYYRRYYDDFRRLPYYTASRYSYLAGEMDYYTADLNRSLENHRYMRRYYSTYYPSYRPYYSDHSLRHFGGYRSYILGYPRRSIYI